MKFVTSFALSAVLVLSAASALAQSTPMQGMPKQQNSMTGMDMSSMPAHGMMGSHMMPATVLSVDTNTGILEADASGMKLRLHFPPASLVSVKAGDKITLHMAFMK